MIAGQKLLGLITARGGSRGVPRKNLREVAGKPLLAWTILAAKKAKCLDRLILSSEDAGIIAVAKKFGCEVPFVRPAELARDETPGIEPVLHAVEQVSGFDVVVLLQPTSPLRVASDIDGCVDMMVAQSAPACVAVSEATQNPYWMYTFDGAKRMVPLIEPERHHRRQDLPPVYMVTGAVYAAEVDWLKKSRTFLSEATVGYVMPRERSLDVDSEHDVMLADQVLRERGTK